jgi:putative membrane protein
MGLVGASIYFCFRQLQKIALPQICSIILGTVLGLILTCMPPLNPSEDLFDVPLPKNLIAQPNSSKKIENYNIQTEILTRVPLSTIQAMAARQSLNPSTLITHRATGKTGKVSEFISGKNFTIKPYLILCGAIAVCAMLLPGVSGSYMLTVLGVYAMSVGALADFISGIGQRVLDEEALSILGSLLIGIILGALCFSNIVSWLLKFYRDSTLALLTGVMMGSLPAIWPFWSYAYVINPLKIEKGIQLQTVQPILPDLGSLAFAALFAFGGLLLVLLLEKPQKSSPLGSCSKSLSNFELSQ